MRLISKSSEQTFTIGKQIGTFLQKGSIIALQGCLGAGKTALTQGIAQGLGIFEPITSPTFTLISEYEGTIPLYHMDVYRLDSTDDFLNLGVEDLLYGDGVSIIEWSEKIMNVLPKDVITISITIEKDNSRIINFSNWPYKDLSN